MHNTLGARITGSEAPKWGLSLIGSGQMPINAHSLGRANPRHELFDVLSGMDMFPRRGRANFRDWLGFWLTKFYMKPVCRTVLRASIMRTRWKIDENGPKN